MHPQEFDEFFALLRDAATDTSLRQLISNAYTEMGKGSVTYVDESGNLVLPEPEWFSRPVQEETELPVKKQRKIYWAVAALAVRCGLHLFYSKANLAPVIISGATCRCAQQKDQNLNSCCCQTARRFG